MEGAGDTVAVNKDSRFVGRDKTERGGLRVRKERLGEEEESEVSVVVTEPRDR